MFGFTGEFGIEAGTLFLIQFFGSFHFSIGWFCMTIMRGFFMLPTGKKTKGTALQIIFIHRLVDFSYFFLFFVYTGFIYYAR
jgi:protoheme IX farnesyltransferase